MSKKAESRYDIVHLFDCLYGNPNGDPDAGNQPRMNMQDNTCLVTDVCLKALLRKALVLSGLKTYIQQETNLNRILAEHAERHGISLDPENPRKEVENEDARRKFIDEYIDAKLFGAVLASGPNFGAITGPVQLTFASSVDPVAVLNNCITRVCKSEDKDDGKKLVTADDYRNWESRQSKSALRSMGQKPVIEYGLFRGNAFISGYRSSSAGLTEDEVNLFLDSLENMFENNRTASKGTMACRGIAVFKHVGTAPDALERSRQALKGCAHAHKLFDLLKVSKKDGVESPKSFADYDVSFNLAGVPAGVECLLLAADDWKVIK